VKYACQLGVHGIGLHKASLLSEPGKHPLRG
jgi:hypothetical protein